MARRMLVLIALDMAPFLRMYRMENLRFIIMDDAKSAAQEKELRTFQEIAGRGMGKILSCDWLASAQWSVNVD